MALDPIGVLFTAKDLASAQIQKLDRQFKTLDNTTESVQAKFTKNIKLMGAGLAAMGAGAVMLAPLAVATQRAADLEEVLLDVRKVAGDGVNIAQLNDDLNKMGPALGKTSQQLATMAVGAAQLGVTGNDNFNKFVSGASKMAVALDITEETASTVGAKLLNVFELGTGQLENLGSAFNEMANTAAASSEEIIAASFRSAGSLKMLGLSAGDVAALNTRLVETGLRGDMAGTSLRRAFEMAAAQPQKLAKAMGVSVDEVQRRLGEDAMGTILQFSEELALMPNKAEALGIASKVFGEEGSKAVVRLGSDMERVNFLITKANKGFDEGTSLQKEFDSVTQGFNFSVKQLGAAWDAIVVTFGNQLLPLLTPLIKGFADFFSKLLEFIQPFAGLIAKTTAFIGSVLILSGAILFLKGAFGLLALFAGKLLIMLAPIVGIVLALSAAIFLFYKAFQENFGGFGDFVRDMFNKVSLFFRALFDLVTKGEISEALYRQLQDAGILEFTEMIIGAFLKVKSFLGGVFDGFMIGIEAMTPGIQMMIGSFMSLGQTIMSVFGLSTGKINEANAGGESFSGTLMSMAETGRMVGAILGNVFAMFANVITGLVSLINMVIEGFLQLGSLAKAFSEDFSGTLGDMGGFAKELAGDAISGIGSFLFGGDEESTATVTGSPGIGNQPVPVGIGAGLNVPTAGLDANVSAVDAQVGSAKNNNSQLIGAMDQQSKNEKPIEVTSVLNLDGRRVAESVNRVNKRGQLLSGGQQ